MLYQSTARLIRVRGRKPNFGVRMMLAVLAVEVSALTTPNPPPVRTSTFDAEPPVKFKLVIPSAAQFVTSRDVGERPPLILVCKPMHGSIARRDPKPDWLARNSSNNAGAR